MKLLALDTVTEYCSVALLDGDDLIIREQAAGQKHTELVLPMVNDVLSEAQTGLSHIDAIVFDRGPGSFTGLRIGAGIVQGLSLGADLPVIKVSSLNALAQCALRVFSAKWVLACIDARQTEIYWASFQLVNGLMTNIDREHLTPPDKLQVKQTGEYFGVGTGFASYKNELLGNSQVVYSGFDGQTYPLAQDLLPFAKMAWKQGDYVDATAVLPVYLRDKVATPPVAVK